MSVCLYTDLSVKECLQRLSASGWAGEAKPHVGQPTALDRDMFRVVEGRRFALSTRS